MTLQDLLSQLREKHIALSISQGELVVRAPSGAMNPALLAVLKAHKPALLTMSAEDLRAALEPAPAPIRITPEMLTLVALEQRAIDALVARVPGGAANVQDIYPLAPLQQGILFHHLLEGEGDAYLMRSVVAFDRRSRRDAFLAALQRVIDRHDILRSAVHWEDLPQPVQVVHRRAALPVEEIRIDAGAAALPQLLAATDPRRMRLDLRRAPILAAYTAFDADTGEWLLALLRHHMVADHVTMDLVLSEIRQLLEGRGDRLPAPMPYRNFIARTHAVADSEHETYFRAQLGDIDEPTAPFGVLDTQVVDEAIRESRVAAEPELAAAIREAARLCSVTPAVLFHVGWARVLGTLTERDDVVFGTVLSGRLQGSEAADRVVGMFINTLPIRVPLASVDVREAVRDTYARLSELLVHEQASLALAQRCSAVAPPLPLFTTLLNYRYGRDDGEGASAAATGSVWEGMRRLGGDAGVNFPLTLSVEDRGRGFGLVAQCVAAIDPEQLVACMATAMRGLVDALAQAPATPLRSIPMLPAAERERVLVDFNRTQSPYPEDRLIHQLFEEQAAQRPQAAAVVFEDQQLGYEELNRRANRVAHRLIALGVKPDDRVAICVERGFDMVVGLLGILKAGGAYVPLDPGYPLDRLAYMLEDSAPVALLTQQTLRTQVPALEVAGVAVLALDDAAWDAGCDSNPDPVALGLTARHLAYVIYTSGSTGRPKGVMVEHRGLCNLAVTQIDLFGVDPDSRVLQFASFSFDASISEVMMSLCSGACLHLAAREALLPGEPLCATLDRYRITHVTLPSSALAALADYVPASGELTLVIAGEAFPPELARRWMRRARVFNAYGPTEATVCASAYEIRSLASDAHSVPIGRPIANTRIYLLDASGNPVPVGVQGEVCIGGVGVARGYLHRPELTAERFIPDRLSQESDARLYRTGDLARWHPDGTLEYLGRNDFQVKVRGFRIELGEIEARLAVCPGVHEAVVIARREASGDQRLVAYVVAQDGMELSAAALREALARHLTDYMVPSAFVVLDALPLTPNGKLDRKALPAPDQSAVAAREYVAPQGEVEEAIAAVWQDLLGLERVGRFDHFFELGGHSLLATRVVVRLKEALQVELDLRDLFSEPQLEQLAQVITQRQLEQFDQSELLAVLREMQEQGVTG